MAGELLDIACERIMLLARPAYIKDSELRFVAVNDAYARLFGRAADELRGLRSEDIDEFSSQRDIDDCERRALVFGREETAMFSGGGWIDDQIVAIERFMPGDDSAFVLGLFGAFEADDETNDDPVPSFPPLPPDPAALYLEVSPPSDGRSKLDANVIAAFDLLEIGLGVFDPGGRLVYCNNGFRTIYGVPCGAFDLGVSYRTLLERIYDYTGVHYPERIDAFGTREGWVSNRLEQARRPLFDRTEPSCDGGWLRCINRCLDDGTMIVLRLDVSAETERELALERQVGETELFRLVLEQVPVAVFARDEAHRLIYVNKAYEAMTGRERQALVGTLAEDVFPIAGAGFLRGGNEVLEKGAVIELSDMLPRACGSELPVVTRMARIDVGADRFVVGSMTDMSAVKAREAQLEDARQAAENLHRDVRSVLNAMPVGILIIGRDRHIEFANPVFHEIWDIPPSVDLIGSNWRDYARLNFDRGLYTIYGDDFEDVFYREFEARLQELHATGRFDQREVDMPNGKTLIITAKTLSGGKTLVSYIDISAMRENERQIRETQRELERVGRLMQDATRVMTQGLLVMENGHIALSNEAAAHILHLPLEMIAQGAPFEAILDHCADRGDFGEDAESLRRSWRDIAGERKSFSHGFLAAGTTWVQFEASFSGHEHWMVVLHDLTEMKRREEELTGLLARSEAADRAKSDFLANMSHEIRTPMNGVLGMAELLSRTQLDTRQRTFVDIIGKSGNALLTIINDILDFSRIDAGKMRLRKSVFDPVEAVEDVATLLSSSAAEKDIELMVRCGAGLPQAVIGDAGRFRQIVTNLVGNAIKFTEAGHVLIELDAVQDGQDEDTILIDLRVRDTGIGIAPEKLDTIFEKFSQGDNSASRRHEGTGLGLAITSGLVDLFGGFITVDSVVGEGSVFSVRLPVGAKARYETRALPVNVSGARVLVVDDNPVSCGILEEQIGRWGFDAFATGHSGEVLALLRAAADLGLEVDAVVLDHQASSLSSADIAAAIRADRRFDTVAIIVLTSMDAVVSDDVFAALKVQAHLMKPARAKVLRNTIVDAVRGMRLRRSGCDVPLLPGKEEARAPAARPALQEGIDVLVAEDNEVNCIVFSQILQVLDLRFLIVNDGGQAVEAWQKHKPGIILMDVSMPVMTGHQATAAIREREAALLAQGADVDVVPIIGVTAHAHAIDRDLCFQAGMNDYLSKPLSPEMLKEKIDRWLPRAASASDAGST